MKTDAYGWVAFVRSSGGLWDDQEEPEEPETEEVEIACALMPLDHGPGR